MEDSQQSLSVQKTDNGKTVAIVSYLSIIGWIIAFVIYGNDKTTLGAYHLRQTIALFIVGICTWVLQVMLVFIPFIGWIISILLIFVYIGLFVLWLIGLMAAINGQEKPIPVIGKRAQVWFHGI
ncbi:MAG: DUF4870 domain-containing protein [Mucilaginibacter sp.]